MKLHIHSRTHIGKIRQINEDAHAIWTPSGTNEDEVALLAVADGMGGHPGGEIASALAVEGALEIAAGRPDVPPRELLRFVFQAARDRIRHRSIEEPRYREMGTTLTCAWFAEGRVHVGHVGDTRLYWFRGDRFVQISVDHTMAQDLVDSGKLDPEEAEEHPTSHVLTRCLGICPRQQPDLLRGSLALRDGDTLLLASDGLAKTVHDETLADMILGADPLRATEWMMEAALAAGAPDNVTVIVARAIGEAEGAPPPTDEEPVYDLEGDQVPLVWTTGD